MRSGFVILENGPVYVIGGQRNVNKNGRCYIKGEISVLLEKYCVLSSIVRGEVSEDSLILGFKEW